MTSAHMKIYFPNMLQLGDEEPCPQSVKQQHKQTSNQDVCHLNWTSAENTVYYSYSIIILSVCVKLLGVCPRNVCTPVVPILGVWTP